MSTLLLMGCASQPKSLTQPVEADPFESMNRSVYAFNKQVDRVVLKPVAEGYSAITPSLAQQGISNFFDNLTSPWTIGQLILQGRWVDASQQTGRFFINTVYGVGGVFDLADQQQLPDYETDLGATLAQWGWKHSRFIVLPVLGPSTIRDGFGQVTEIIVNPVDDELRQRAGMGVTALDVVQTRARYLSIDGTLESAYDEYAFVRDGWLQRRDYQLFGEQNDLPDYDAFLEDLDEPQDP